jgi:hypothetical protein
MPGKSEPKFPKQSAELLMMLEQDQKELREFPRLYNKIVSENEKDKVLKSIRTECHVRAIRMMAILNEIGDPTVENVGLEASEAVAVIALHSYLGLMKKILRIYEHYYIQDRANIYYQAIPSLVDRIMILEQRRQLFGTNWSLGKNDKPFLIAVEDFSKMNEKRAQYDLEPRRRPVNSAVGAVKYPLGRGLAKKTDQKQLTDEEYEEFSRYVLGPLLPESTRLNLA